MIGQRPPNPHHHKTRHCESRSRAVLLGSLTLLLSTQVPIPNKISRFVRTCVSSDNSFPSVRQEPSFGPWKESPFLQQSEDKYIHIDFFLLPRNYNAFPKTVGDNLLSSLKGSQRPGHHSCLWAQDLAQPICSREHPLLGGLLSALSH